VLACQRLDKTAVVLALLGIDSSGGVVKTTREHALSAAGCNGQKSVCLTHRTTDVSAARFMSVLSRNANGNHGPARAERGTRKDPPRCQDRHQDGSPGRRIGSQVVLGKPGSSGLRAANNRSHPARLPRNVSSRHRVRA